MEREEINHKNRLIGRRILICALVLLAGAAIMVLLIVFKKPPSETEAGEVPIKVNVVTVEKRDYPVTISGYGEVRSTNEVAVASEVAGKVTAVHPRLEPGEIIPQGELLFQIDDRDFQTAVSIGSQRLEVLKKNKALAEKEYQRVFRLFAENNVGTVSGVDMAEKSLLSAADMVLQLEQALESARINLDRCRVRARFDARISRVAIEAGQYVAPGQQAVTLVDDTALEIQVAVDSRDIRDWLPFTTAPEPDSAERANWFADVSPLPCVIKWTEDSNITWNGRLDRIVLFDPRTRTITIAVRVEPTPAAAFPLVKGMFCRVEIPGRRMNRVVRLPRPAVSFEDTAFTVVDDRLKTVPVTVVREEGDVVYVSDGLENGDRVITTRLIDPLENTLLSIINPKNSGR